jgi:hypothetical protein
MKSAESVSKQISERKIFKPPTSTIFQSNITIKNIQICTHMHVNVHYNRTNMQILSPGFCSPGSWLNHSMHSGNEGRRRS